MSNVVYKVVTDQILNIMHEQGIIPWEKPWVNGNCPARGYEMRPGDCYTGINRILLPFQGEYLSRTQVEKHGGRIIDWHKSYIVTFYKEITRREATGEDALQEETPRGTFRVLRYYRVFHIDNVEGVEPRVKVRSDNAASMQPVEAAEGVVSAYLERSGVRLTHTRGDEAGYSESEDRVTIPHMDQFNNVESYYSVLFHELVHSTGHEERLCRDVRQAAYDGNENRFTREELVAEMGAAFLMSRCGLDIEKVIRNTAARLQGWINAFQNDVVMLTWAAGKAEKAVNMILGEV